MADFVSTGSKCNTCKVVFQTTEEIRDHYRTDWHVMNSRRRGNGLIPITYEEFKRTQKKGKDKQITSKTSAYSAQYIRGKETTKSITMQSVLKVDLGKRENLRIPTPASANVPSSSGSGVSSFATLKPRQPINTTATTSSSSTTETTSENVSSDTPMVVEPATATTAEELQGGLDSDEDEEEFQEEEYIELPVGPHVSLFDVKEFNDGDECIEYMENEYGFFIPDRENLTDRDGLLNYLGEKIKRGGMCIYCQKRFKPGWSCIRHMVDSSHCKMAYQEDDDFDEFEDFYEFEGEFEDVDENEEDGVDDDNESGKKSSLKVNSIGELILLDGRLAGHRDLRRYYKQYFTPVDDRPCILAVKRENLRKFITSGNVGSSVNEQQLLSMDDAALMRLIEVQHKEVKKSRMLAERQQTRVEFKTKRRAEYKSTVDKLRSCGNRNPIIRDYHGRLQ